METVHGLILLKHTGSGTRLAKRRRTSSLNNLVSGQCIDLYSLSNRAIHSPKQAEITNKIIVNNDNIKVRIQKISSIF